MTKGFTNLLLLLAFGCGCSHSPNRTINQQIPVIAESLARIDPDMVTYSLAVSNDRERLAYVRQRGDKQVVVVDGREGNPYDEISTQAGDGRGGYIVFSRDGQHVAFAARRGKKWRVVLDGVEGKSYDWIDDYPTTSIVFSVDGHRLAYTAQRGHKEFCVVDGVDGHEYDKIGHPAGDNNRPVFSPNGNHVAFIATNGKDLSKLKSFMVLDGKEVAEYDFEKGEILSGDLPEFNPSGDRLIFWVNDGDKFQRVAIKIPNEKRK